MKSLGKLLRSLREKAGYRQADFAERLGVSGATLSRAENGTIPLYILRKAADALSLPVSMFYKAGAGAVRDLAAADRIEQSPIWQPTIVADTCLAYGDVVVGAGTELWHYSILEAVEGKITIGRDCYIGHHVTICTAAWVRTRVPSGSTFVDGGPKRITGDVTIGSRVVVGPRAIILPGVDIPDDASISAGEIVGDKQWEQSA